jgi:hypothetical protein
MTISFSSRAVLVDGRDFALRVLCCICGVRSELRNLESSHLAYDERPTSLKLYTTSSRSCQHLQWQIALEMRERIR